MIDAAYAACLAFGTWCDRHRLRILLVGAPAYLVLLVAVGALVLQRFPNSGDEYVYLYEAATIGEGRLSNPLPRTADAFDFNYIVRDGGRAFGTFPPGWPLALAVAAWLDVPAWLLNPLLGVATVVVLWALARELHGARIGALAAALTAISPFFVFNAASYFSHTFCGFLLVLAAYAASIAHRRPVFAPLLVGFLIGWAVLTRYFTGVVGGVAVAALLASRTRPRQVHAFALVAAGGAPFVALLAIYNAALSGSPWRLTTLELTKSLWFAPGFATRGLDILATQLLQFLLWTPPALLGAYLWYVRGTARLIDWLFPAMAILLIFYVNRGGNQYGPRFYYEAFLFLVIVAAAGLFRDERLAVADRAGRGLFAAMAVSVAVVPLLFAVHARQVRTVIGERTDIFTRVADARITNALVLVGGRVGSVRSMDAHDLTRNGIDYSGDVLFALDRGPAGNCELATAHPGRTMYRYVWEHAQRRGRLTVVRCE